MSDWCSVSLSRCEHEPDLELNEMPSFLNHTFWGDTLHSDMKCQRSEIAILVHLFETMNE